MNGRDTGGLPDTPLCAESEAPQSHVEGITQSIRQGITPCRLVGSGVNGKRHREIRRDTERYGEIRRDTTERADIPPFNRRRQAQSGSPR
jgi:hypothetical protein